MEWAEFKEAVRTALASNDTEELKHLEWIDGTWFVLALDEINEA